MSIKTLRKRIALVAVSALGAGVLSVAVVPSANAGGLIAAASNLGSPVNAAGAGICIASTTSTDTAVVNRVVVTGAITIAVDDNSDDVGNNEVVTFVMTGPAVWLTAASSDIGGNTGVTLDVSADAKTLTFTGDNDGGSSVIADPTLRLTGAGKVEIKTFAGTTATLRDTLTIYSVDACDSGSYSAATSKSKLQTDTTALTAASALALTGDTTGANVRKYSDKAYIALWLTDKYGAEIDETASFLTATATNGVLVSFDNTTFTGTAVATSNLNDEVVIAKLPTGVTAPTSTTISISLNGTVVATRSVTFTGQPAKIVVGSIASHVATSATDALTVIVQDAAGNQLADWTPEAGAATANKNGASVGSFNASSATATVAATLTAGSTEGESETTIRVKLDDGSYIVSDPIKFFTSTASIATFTVAADKAVYAPGEVVTITVTGKNAKGNPVAATTALGGTVTWVGAGLTKVSADPVAADTPTGGAWTYKFYASTTEGSYGFSLATTSASVTVTPQTGTFTVKSGAISNAEVLASIVKLIAAINKQIRALQRALRR